ncbi:MAG: hypothetical protein WA672_05525 [Candidatus Angelobacter sp.]
MPVEIHIQAFNLLKRAFALTSKKGDKVRVAVAAMLLAFVGPSALALVKDGRVLTPASASTPASDSAAAASASVANAASAPTSVSPNALVAALPDAPAISAEVRTVEPLSPAPSASEPALGSGFLPNNSLAPIHALVAPPAAVIKLKPPPRTHSFFDARNRLGFATLGASLTADALSTQKGLAYPGFVEMNPIARPFVQSRMGAAAYNAGSFGLVAGLMYWAHKTEHHKLERILPLAVGSWEGLLSARNYRVIANRAR